MPSTTSTAAPQLLLQTKLYQPPPADNLITRPQLLDYLSQPFPRKLTLITASAGYGKTTIITQWLDQLVKTRQQDAASIAWLSLDEYDDELPLFLRYLVAAIQTAYPGFGENILAALSGAQSPSWQLLADMLANDLMRLAQSLYLTLDDYHVITADAIHQLLNRLLERMPLSVHLILISRTEPPLALGRLRVRRQMQELRADNLSFSLQDTAHFMTQTLGRELRPETLQTLHTGSEGWIAGLQLVALSRPQVANESQPFDEASLLQHFQGNNPYYTDYLFEEVLVLQPLSIQEFLLQTALLDRFCAPLCQAVLGAEWLSQVRQDRQLPSRITASQAPIETILDWLQRANLFLVPLDNQGIWYRYHHLFQQMLNQILRERLGADHVITLHRRASAWLAAEGFTESAIRHALAAGDAHLAAQLIEEQRHHLLSRHDFHILDRWLSWLPVELVAQRPALLVAQGWRNYFFYRARSTYATLAAQAEEQLKNADIQLDEIARLILVGEIHALKVFSLPLYSHAAEIWQYIESAFRHIPAGYTFVYPYLTLAKASILNDQGKVAEAHAYLEQAQRAQQKTSSALSTLFFMHGFIHFNNGNLQQGTQGLEALLNTDDPSRRTPFVQSHLHSILGSIYYEWNQLDRATDHLTNVIDIPFGYSLGAFKRAALILSAVYQAQGQTEESKGVIARIYELDIAKLNDGYFLNEVQSFQANLLLRRGALEQAWQLFRSVQPTPLYVLDMFTEMPLLTQAQLLIARGAEADLAEAGEILQTLKATTGPVHHRSRRIKVLALEALRQQVAGQQKQALATLEAAITLAQPDHFIRTFVDLGSGLVRLLEQLRQQQIEPDYIGQILMAFPEATQAQQPLPPIQPTQPSSRPPAKLVEPLTDREREILVLLAERLSNKEIAHLLDVSPFTVKNHLSTIYQKLGVSGRRQAVNRAERAGLLH
ncbi:MAG: LuxR C-terminal-related transcriptional regulator [Caldilineaceae bacterium]